MLTRLSRILLALVTAFVFTGQMEAAAEHCARLAHAAAQAVEAPDAGCHETAQAAAASHGRMTHHGDAADMTQAPQAPDHCECIAALHGWTSVSGPLASTLAAPYAWLTPAAMRFASSEPDPDLRPPRA